MNKFFILTLTTFFIASPLCLSNVENANFEKSVKKGFMKNRSSPFRYWPTDEKFWNYYQLLNQNGDIDGAIQISWSQLQKFGEATPDGSEARLAMSQILLKKGYSHASFLTLVSLAQNQIGTQVGFAALYELASLTKNFIYDQQTLTNLLNSNDFDGLHPEIQSFVSYHKALRNMIFGYNKWTKKHLSQIHPQSYWGHLFKYWSAVGEVAREKLDSAKTQFKNLHDNTEAALSLRDMAGLQVARLEFEDGKFKTAYDIYSHLSTLGIREQGRIQLERIWTQYYVGNYSKALGLLYSLRAPYFRPSLNPEKFILEMLIYRKLCHYKAVSQIAKEFKRTYKSAFRAIRRRHPLRNNKILLSMSLMNKDIQDRANLIDHIRKEKKSIRNEEIVSKFVNDILHRYKKLDKRLQMKIDYQIEDQVRQMANKLLDVKGQVSFLRYMSKLDSLRVVRRGEDRKYISGRVPTSTFDRIYWPVDRKFGIVEYWSDEFEDYKMLISSRCQPEIEVDLKQQKIEREFK